MNVYDLMPKLAKGNGALSILDDISINFYGKTNWMVRRSMLEAYCNIKD